MDLTCINLLNIPVCVINSDGLLIYQNERYSELFKAGTDTISLDEEHEFFSTYRKRVALCYSNTLAGKDSKCFVVLKAGEKLQIPVELYFYPIILDDNKPGIFTIFKEVDDRIVSFDRTTIWQEEDDSLYEFSPNPLISINKDLEIIKISPSAEKIFETNRVRLAEEKGLFFSFFTNYDAEKIKTAINEIHSQHKEFIRLNDLCIHSPLSDQKKYCNIHLYPHKKNGSISVEMVFEDITKIKNFEERLTKMNKIQILSDMTKGLLHSFNNQINVILNRTQMLMQMTEQNNLIDGLTTINDSAIEAASQIRRIQDFISTDPTAQSEDYFDIIELIHDSIEICSIHFKVENKEKRRKINISKQYYTRAMLKGDMKLLREIIVSMIFRISTHIINEGTIYIELKKDEDIFITINLTKEELEQEPLEENTLFLPEIDLRRIADRAHIRIFEEESSEKISYTAVIPSKMVESPEKIETTDNTPKIRNHDILIVEDEPALSQILFELFDFMGNRVSIFEDAEAGLKDFKSHKYDIVISDYGLNGITGLEFLTKIKEIEENTMTVLLSGWVLENIDLYEKSIDIFLQKPFKIETLLQEIGKSLNQ